MSLPHTVANAPWVVYRDNSAEPQTLTWEEYQEQLLGAIVTAHSALANARHLLEQLRSDPPSATGPDA